MKISVLTATYNREKEIEELYNSLIINNNSGIDFEWLIMDDGSTDNTKTIIQNFMKQEIIDIKYFYQENRGKMSAINKLVEKMTGDICLTCDSDDRLSIGAFDIIKKYSDRLLNDDTVYALVFLKSDNKGKISGNEFPENLHRTDEFSMYFREKMDGEKILVFDSKIRKKFKHEIEDGEKFVTEARMYHKMDEKYDVIGINEVIEIGDYEDDGYTKNYLKIYKENPKGFYEFFKEILEKSLVGVTFDKRKYIYKHYILFAILSNQKNAILSVNGFVNKIIVAVLWIPGKIMTKKRFLNSKSQVEK